MSQLFSSSSDTCGPVNPLQNLGKHAGPTNSAQHERFVRENSVGSSSFRSSPSPSLMNGNNNDFQAFSIRGSQVPTPPGFEFHTGQIPGQVPRLNQRSQSFSPANFEAQSQQPDWASEFSKLSVGGSRQDLKIRQSPGPATTGFQQYQPLASSSFQTSLRPDLMAYQTSASFSEQTEHSQIHKLNQDQASFENAFAAVERSLQIDETSQEPVAENTTSSVSDNELSGVAQNIINSVNETSQSINQSTASKMKSSNFMALMDQLSKKNVILEGNKFVDGVSGSEVKPEQLSRQEDISHVYQHPTLPDNLNKTNTAGPLAHEIPLQDPFSFMDQMNIDPTKMTPFELAQSIIPGGVKMSDWEEKYDEDSDWIQ